MATHKAAQSVPASSLDDLYFIQAGSRVKIGRAKDPFKRLRSLQTGCPDELEVISVLIGRGYEERVWHWAFCAAKTKGEWFEFTDELDWAIASGYCTLHTQQVGGRVGSLPR